MVDGRRGIWDNYDCVQCGVCCYDWNRFLFSLEIRSEPRCKNFYVADGKAYCSVHNESREQICKDYFCGRLEPQVRSLIFDNRQREIASEIGTVPRGWNLEAELEKAE